MTTASTTTNQRILVAVLRLLTYGDLPRRKDVEKLVQEPSKDRANFLTHAYLTIAEAANVDRNKAEHRAPHMAAERLVSCAMYAAHLGYPIRFAAQGIRGDNPAAHVWCLLNAVLTLLVVRTRTAQERTALEQQAHLVALNLGEL